MSFSFNHRKKYLYGINIKLKKKRFFLPLTWKKKWYQWQLTRKTLNLLFTKRQKTHHRLFSRSRSKTEIVNGVNERPLHMSHETENYHAVGRCRYGARGVSTSTENCQHLYLTVLFLSGHSGAYQRALNK